MEKDKIETLSWEEIEKSYIEALSGNCRLEEAKILFLADSNHLDKKQNLVRQRIINLFAKPNDILLLEAIAHLREIDQRASKKTNRIQPPVQVFGWDDLQMRKAGMAEFKKAVALEEQLNKSKNSLNSITKADVDKQYEKAYRWIRDERNLSLVRSLEFHLEQAKEKGQSIFVIGGEAHFDEKSVISAFHNEKYVIVKLSILSDVSDEKVDNYIKHCITD